MTALLPLTAVTGGLQAADAKAQSRLERITHRPKGPTIKVLLHQDIEGSLVEVKGAYNLYDPHTGKKLKSAFSGSSYYLHPTADGIKWGEEFPGVYQVLIVPDDSKTTVLVQGIEYRGMVYAYQFDGTIGFVNEVTLDDYADSIVAGMIQSQVKEPEAIAALTIAARTDAFQKSQHGKTKYWDVKAVDVGYQGFAVTLHDKAYTAALQATSKMVLNTEKPISWFATAPVPFQEIQTKAQEGKDAKAILTDFFPDNQIVLATGK